MLEDIFEEFELLDEITSNDKYANTLVTQWVPGATIQAVAMRNDSMEARTGAVQGVKALYTITTHRDIILQYHRVLRRKRDNKIFRATSDGNDVATPKFASLDMRQVSAEEWEMPML